MAEYSRKLANKGASINKDDEVRNPSRAVIDDFNSKFDTVRVAKDATKLGIAKNTIKGIPKAAKDIGKSVIRKVKKAKVKYDKAFEEGQKKPSIVKTKELMKAGYRP